MDLWGPYLAECTRTAATDALDRDSSSDGSLASPKWPSLTDGLFGLTNSGGTIGASFAFWNGRDARLKERLTQAGEVYRHGLADTHYRYASCQYVYSPSPDQVNPQPDASGLAPTFDIRFEMAKELASRVYYRLTVARSSGGSGGGSSDSGQEQAAAASCGASLSTSNDGTSTDGDELTVVAFAGVCHQECGQIQPGTNSARDKSRWLKLSATGTCQGPSRMQLDPLLEAGHRLPAATDEIGAPASTSAPLTAHASVDDTMNRLRYRLHYQAEGLQSVAFCAATSPGLDDAFNRFVVYGDASLLHFNENDDVGGVAQESTAAKPHCCRAGLVYRLRVPPGGSVSLAFLLAREDCDSAFVGPSKIPIKAMSAPADWGTVDSLMTRGSALVTRLLECADFDRLPPEEAIRRVVSRAYSNLLWNRQLCPTDAAPQPCLIVVPDKWHHPDMASWEHPLHACVLCRLSPELALAELRNQLARLTVAGELAYVGKPPPPAWPLALLEFLTLHSQMRDASERIFVDMLRHLNWWLIDRVDDVGRSTLDGGVLGLRHRGWIDAKHSAESNDSLVWSGFFCAKMVHAAALLERAELKSLLDLFNAVLSSLRNESACVDGLFRATFISGSGGGGGRGGGGVSMSQQTCCCAFGLTPLLGCACLSWDWLVGNQESRVLLEWLQWLSNETASGTEAPSLFVKTDVASNRFLISWISEAEFVQACRLLFDPDHFLCPHGFRSTSKLLSEQKASDASACCQPKRETVVSLPWNYLLLEALKCWELAYGQRLLFDFPTGAGERLCLNDIIVEISRRLVGIFTKYEPNKPMFYEFYDAETGAGIGGSGQTSWSSLIACVAQNLTRQPTLALHRVCSMPRAVGRIEPRDSVAHSFRQSLRSSIRLEEFAPDVSFDWSAESVDEI